MMLRNLIDEVRNRRILAFAALGVLVLLAVPLLFLKSAPEGAPPANAAAPAAAEEAKLPPRAARLLATTDPGAPGGRATGSAQDPFAPPASYRAAAAASATGTTSATPAAAKSSGSAPPAAGGAASNKPVEVVVTNPGTTPSTSSPARNGSRSSRPSRSLTARNASVDVRFGPRADTKIKRAISRQRGFYIHGKLVAMFVKYSPSRKAAVFALAPGLHITGPVKCRVVDGSCRYLDIPAGEHAWITTITANRTIVSRRLDVVRIKRRTSRSRTRAASASARHEAACMARKLMAMERGDALLHRDACKN